MRVNIWGQRVQDEPEDLLIPSNPRDVLRIFNRDLLVVVGIFSFKEFCRSFFFSFHQIKHTCATEHWHDHRLLDQSVFTCEKLGRRGAEGSSEGGGRGCIRG
jgi:hypothetical protein